MAERKKRGKVSKIDLLPGDIKGKLDELLRNGKMKQKDILREVNLLIEAAGLSENVKLSQSGVNRYSTQMETIGADIRQAREMSEIWVAKLGSKPTGEVSQLLMEMLRSQFFKLMIKANDNPDDVLDPKTIGNLALSIQRLEKAAMINLEKEKQIRKNYAEELAEQLDENAAQIGLTSEGAAKIKAQILGIG
jgi:hypothetical protein